MCRPSPSLNLEPLMPPRSHWLKSPRPFALPAAVTCTEVSETPWGHHGGQRPQGCRPALSLRNPEDGWQGNVDLAPLAPCHGGSRPSCGKHRAANGLSRLCSYFGRNQPEGWGNGPKRQGSREEDPVPSDSERNYRISMPQRLSGNTLLVKVPGCRNNPTREQRHCFLSITPPSSKLMVSNLVICILISQWDSPHFKQSDLNLMVLKQIIIYFWLSQFSGTPSIATAVVSAGSCRALPLVSPYSQVQLKGCFL